MFTLLDYPGMSSHQKGHAIQSRAAMNGEARMGSFDRRLYYALLTFLMCIAALAFFSLIWSLDTRAKVTAFASEGTLAQGVVLDKAWSYKASTTSHKVQVRFVDLAGVEHVSWIQTHPLVYERLSVRGPVKVTYLRSKPQTFYLSDDAPTMDRATGFAYGAIGCGVLALILAVAVFRLRRRLRDSVSVANVQFRGVRQPGAPFLAGAATAKPHHLTTARANRGAGTASGR